ncbi:hypothetical protein AO269_02735 [Pseudomonas putida]|nr:hypothetical protein AO269_02735 [Pseudomonas putida]
MEAQRRHVLYTQAAQQVRPCQKGEGHQCRSGIARQADDRHAPKVAEGQRLAGFDRQFPEGQLTLLAQGDAEKIGFAHRDAPRGQNQVHITQRRQALACLLQIVGQNPGVHHFAAQPTQGTAQHLTIAVVDLSGPQRLTRFDQFIACRQYRHPWSANHVDMGLPHGRQQSQLDRAQSSARHQQAVADTGFLPLRTDVLANSQGLVEAHPLIILDASVFLHFHAVGAVRHRGAGEDACAGAGLQRLGYGAGEDTLADAQGFTLPIVSAQRVAVHGAVGPGWQVEGGDQVIGEDPTAALGQGDLLTLGDERGIGHGQQLRQRLLDR